MLIISAPLFHRHDTIVVNEFVRKCEYVMRNIILAIITILHEDVSHS